MTRNEWIAQVVLREIASEGIDSAIAGAVLCADALEAANVAPWQSAPPLTDAAANVVEAAVAWADWMTVPVSTRGIALHAAVRAYRESVK